MYISWLDAFLSLVDDNHKPEMALALTPFQAMCGFLPLPSIARNLKATPELAALMPSDTLSNFYSLSSSSSDDATAKSSLKDVFSALMHTEENTFKPQLAKLIERYKSDESAVLRDLVLRLDSQFPGDIGIFCALLLNHITLKPGEAIFLGAGEPHAYVTGGKSFHPSIFCGPQKAIQ
jgi:mannose-6-phosphate isomerase